VNRKGFDFTLQDIVRRPEAGFFQYINQPRRETTGAKVAAHSLLNGVRGLVELKFSFLLYYENIDSFAQLPCLPQHQDCEEGTRRTSAHDHYRRTVIEMYGFLCFFKKTCHTATLDIYFIAHM
jgi:hypothetical protein